MLLMCGFLFDAKSWQNILQKNGYPIKYLDAFSSSGLSIFTKYIPGKIWTILGRATYISEKYSIKTVDTSTASLQAQLLSLWSGTLIALLSLIGYKTNSQTLQYWLLALLIFWILLSIALFYKGFMKYSSLLLSKILNKDIQLPNINERKKIKTVPDFLAIWFFWSLAFFFLIDGINLTTLPFTTGFSFALGGTLGIIAVFAPGGLGIREGVIVAYLVTIGLSIEEATTISIVSRLWYLIGESIFFITAFTVKSIKA